MTIDNCLLSIVIGTKAQISDSRRPEPGKSRAPGFRATRGRDRCQPPPLSRTRTAPPSRSRSWPWSGGLMRGRCWRSSGSTIRRSKPPTPLPREAFLRPPPWTASSPFGGYLPLAGADPVILYQDLVVALDPARGVNNGSPSLHAKLLEALGPAPGERIVHVGAGAGYYSAILAELVGSAGQVTAVEFDAALAKRAEPSSPAAPTSASSMATAPAGLKPRPTGSMSISPCPGRRIAGSRAWPRVAASSSRSASRDRSE
jgi:hypothetical protein